VPDAPNPCAFASLPLRGARGGANAPVSPTSDENALKLVRSVYGQNFPQQADLVARTIELGGSYKLGTLSDHALGRAVEIGPDDNAQIGESDWKDILTLTGKSLDQATRTAQRITTPQALHTAINAPSCIARR
jgi:hypothetical protein